MNYWKFITNLTGYVGLVTFAGLALYASIVFAPSNQPTSSMENYSVYSHSI
jgi:hypothetical protein